MTAPERLGWAYRPVIISHSPNNMCSEFLTTCVDSMALKTKSVVWCSQIRGHISSIKENHVVSLKIALKMKTEF